jgi:hypothetical protein
LHVVSSPFFKTEAPSKRPFNGLFEGQKEGVESIYFSEKMVYGTQLLDFAECQDSWVFWVLLQFIAQLGLFPETQVE